MIILGLHKDPWHNTCACMIRDDGDGPRIVQLAQERLDRVKDSRAWPEDAIKACMTELGVSSVSEIDLVVLDYIRDKDWRRDHYKTECRSTTFLSEIDPKRIEVVNHHLAHAFAVYYSSPFYHCAILVVDGRGSDQETQSLFVVDEWGLRLLESTDAVGLGMLYATVTESIGFGILQEGKTMGLAPYGGKNKRIMDFWGRYSGIVTDYSRFVRPGSYIPNESVPLDTFEAKAQAAFDVQEELEFGMLHLARHAKQVTGKQHLCITGGVGLNSVANWKIVKSGLFEDVFINPAASDTGIALGCALYGYHEIKGRPAFKFGPYLGPTYTAPELTLPRLGGLREAVKLLVENKIVSHFESRSEMGPRALGHRSILMSPLVAENKNRLNSRVKHREEFRPFAPAVPLGREREYFDLDRPSPYMLLVPEVRQDKRSVIPAVTHVDGTARVQTVTPECGMFASLIEEFGHQTGVPVLLNTSFNVAGEPIVETPEDAVRCFLGTDIDALLLDGVLYGKDRKLSLVAA